mgnify:CR=1 FL=1
MSQVKKLIKRMQRTQIGFRFEEVLQVLHSLGYLERPGGGSHHVFTHPDPDLSLIMVEKPHGGRKDCDRHDVQKVVDAIAIWERKS